MTKEMFSTTERALSEAIIEVGIGRAKTITMVFNTCARCKCREFVSPVEKSNRKYILQDDDTIQIWEEWILECIDCGLRQELCTITQIPSDESFPRRDLLKAAMFEEIPSYEGSAP